MIKKQLKQLFKKNIVAILRQLAFCVILLLIITTTSCSPSNAQNKRPTPTIISNISQNNINITIFKVPEKFTLAEDTYISIKVETALGTTTTIPNLSPYCTGFKLISEFNTPITKNDQITTYTHYVHLQPRISAIYAIEPFSITYKNRSYSPAIIGTVNTPQITFTPELNTLSPPDSIIADFHPIQSSSTEKPKLIKTITVLLFLLIIAGQFLRYHLNSKNSTISESVPRSIAAESLQELLDSNLIAKKEFTDFYSALTGIVRNYIEATLKIPSTHQTSEELISNLKSTQYISSKMITDLKKFFQRADLVKFATINPTQADIANDIAWAKHYIESDLVDKELENNKPC